MAQNFSDFKYKIAAGQVQGATVLFKFGLNPDIDTGTAPEDITTLGGTYIFPVNATTVSIVSTDANDTDGGTGAQTVRIGGLDADYNEIQEELTLNGLTPVVSTKVFFRLHRARVILSGSGETNAGDINMTVDSNPVAQILATNGQTLMAVYTVPAGHMLILEKWMISIQKKTSALATFSFDVRIPGQTWAIKQLIGIDSTGTSTFERTAAVPFPIPEKVDIRVRCIETTVNDVQASSSFDGILIKLEDFRF